MLSQIKSIYSNILAEQNNQNEDIDKVLLVFSFNQTIIQKIKKCDDKINNCDFELNNNLNVYVRKSIDKLFKYILNSKYFDIAFYCGYKNTNIREILEKLSNQLDLNEAERTKLQDKSQGQEYCLPNISEEYNYQKLYEIFWIDLRRRGYNQGVKNTILIHSDMKKDFKDVVIDFNINLSRNDYLRQLGFEHIKYLIKPYDLTETDQDWSKDDSIDTFIAYLKEMEQLLVKQKFTSTDEFLSIHKLNGENSKNWTANKAADKEKDNVKK